MQGPSPIAIDQLPSRPLFEAEPPAELFHYTDFDGVSGILDSRHLWLSKISTLNDMSEINLAMHHFKVLAGEPGAGPSPAEVEFLRLAAAELDSFRRTNICVCSFSEEDDQPSQWRSYGNDGRGMALGFESRKLGPTAARHEVRLVRCIYEPRSHVRITRDLAAALVNALRASPPSGDEDRRRLLAQFCSTFLLVAPWSRMPTSRPSGNGASYRCRAPPTTRA